MDIGSVGSWFGLVSFHLFEQLLTLPEHEQKGFDFWFTLILFNDVS